MKLPLVADIYKLQDRTAISLEDDSSLEDAIKAIIQEPLLHGIFLVDSKQRFVCMVTRVDLLRWAHLKLTGGKGRHEIPVFEFFRIMDAKTAKDLTYGAQQGISVQESDSLQVALDKMLDYKQDIIPVLDREGRILGDLSLTEILWWILAFGKTLIPE